MSLFREAFLSPDISILKAIECIERSQAQIGLVVNDEERLLGTVTDGDVRRGLLRGVALDEPVRNVMKENPTVALLGESRESLLATMTQKKIYQIPLLDEQHRVVGLEVMNELFEERQIDNWVVLMAGGLGNRLQPLTNDCPKPLLKVGSKPLLENIVEKFITQDFRHFLISVNYKAEMIMDHFQDGARLGAEIKYLHEKDRMGTAGALGLIDGRPDKPIVVMNGDLLTEVNFKSLLAFHTHSGASATMCVRQYEFQVPYGVVRVEGESFAGIDEKPVQTFFVNAGIYVLEPAVLELIPKNTHLDIPELFQRLKSKAHKIALFPVREYWLDIGQKEDFDRANEYAIHSQELQQKNALPERLDN